MAEVSMKKLAAIMKGLDICMFTTVAGRGASASRPMSNNGDVDYDGTSRFFTFAKSRTVKEISKNPNVSLSFQSSNLLKKTYVSVSGRAKLIKDKEQMRDHWTKDVEIWFKDGLDTPGIVMIEVAAKRIKYWSGSEEGSLHQSGEVSFTSQPVRFSACEDLSSSRSSRCGRSAAGISLTHENKNGLHHLLPHSLRAPSLPVHGTGGVVLGHPPLDALRDG